MNISQKHLSRFVTIALFTAVMAGTWDAWWHAVLGRESFWSPPHILLYASTVSAVFAGVYGWYKTRERLWKRLALVLLLVPASAPFDELWHRIFGLESIASPLILWSPPHLVLIGAILAASALVLPLLLREEDPYAKQLFGSMAFATILSLTNFLAGPLDPLSPYRLVGFWGTAAESFFLVFVLLIARRIFTNVGAAFSIGILFILLFSIGFSHGANALVTNITPHGHPPLWLVVFSIIISTVFIDLFYKKIHRVFLGGIVGLLSYGNIYFFARFFLEPRFTYGLREVFIAALSASLAGVVGGLFSRCFSRDHP